jgi:hypothetical protein
VGFIGDMSPYSARRYLLRSLSPLSLLVLAGCATIPVQETTLRNADGGTVTCKQVGRGIVSYGVGKSLYEDCIAKAHAEGCK